jgi:hypothetical protein
LSWREKMTLCSIIHTIYRRDKFSYKRRDSKQMVLTN